MRIQNNVGGIGRFFLCLVLAGLSSCSSLQSEKTAAGVSEKQLLDAGWKFHRGEVPDESLAISPDADEKLWEPVNLPHDYVLDGTYDSKLDRSHGYLPLTTAWYRKHFFIPENVQGKSLELQFDGIYRDSQIWLNGQLIGKHASGYSGFNLDISKTAKLGADNVIAVHVDPRHFEGWWYEGGGIYRHVYLNVRTPVHVANWGTQIISEVPGGNQGGDALANVSIETAVVNESTAQANNVVKSEILGPNGSALTTLRGELIVAAGDQNKLYQHCTIAHPKLWSPDSPSLYHLRTTIFQNGNLVDQKDTTFGIRTIFFDANKGFFLNGKHVEIKGVAAHQDFPAVGIAVPDSLQPWRVQQLKNSGANGWRTAHNVCSESVIDACDRLGMLVMDENRQLGDCYDQKARPDTTFTNLADLDYMILRDRNHPSVIMWSMCNEEWVKDLEGSPEGKRIFLAMMDEVHKFDRTRPITSAMDRGWLGSGFADVEDIIGVNYNYQRYDDVHKAHPDKPMFGSETANNKTARSNYDYDKAKGLMSSYNLTDGGWQPVASRPFMAGSYTWTGFDYRGEPNPDGWPDVSNNTGLLDNCGFPKDKFYYQQSWWSEKPMVHLMPVCWNWPAKEGQNIRVIAFSNAKQVEVFLNGKSCGIQTMPQDGHLEWQIPYAPGRLEAKGITDGKLVATDFVETVDAPARIRLSPERTNLRADGQDTIVVPVSILDGKGRLVDNANNRITFELTGGKLLGVGNGNPGDHDPDRASQRNTFNGHCIAVIQAGVKRESMKLTVTSPGLSSATVTFEVK